MDFSGLDGFPTGRRLGYLVVLVLLGLGIALSVGAAVETIFFSAPAPAPQAATPAAAPQSPPGPDAASPSGNADIPDTLAAGGGVSAPVSGLAPQPQPLAPPVAAAPTSVAPTAAPPLPTPMAAPTSAPAVAPHPVLRQLPHPAAGHHRHNRRHATQRPSALAPSLGAPPDSARSWIVQLGAFRDVDNARATAAHYASRGVKVTIARSGGLLKLRLAGIFPLARARSEATSLARKFGSRAYLVPAD